MDSWHNFFARSLSFRRLLGLISCNVIQGRREGGEGRGRGKEGNEEMREEEERKGRRGEEGEKKRRRRRVKIELTYAREAMNERKHPPQSP